MIIQVNILQLWKKYEYPVGKINNYDINFLNGGITLDDLVTHISFINCDIFVDSSIHRPVFQTHMLFNNQNRSICGTGLFKNQLIYIPEILEYQRLTNNLIRLVDDSIKSGYRFESAILFDKFVPDLFNIKKSVNKYDPLYLIAKILMNSLYGRFALRPDLQELILINREEIDTFLLKNIENLCSDVIPIDGTNKYLVILNKTMDNLNISVAIASAITA